ncbi:MAG: transcriptional repressor LexA [Elusimicrobia bacterium]|nr:transcriptional repressor LexA [Elusimicrobiota bacterium]
MSTPPKDPTPLQRRMLGAIADFVEEHGFPPSIRELGRRLRITSPSSVAYHLRVLEEAGLLKRAGSLSRGMTLSSPPNSLPILGRVAAGTGIVAEEDVEGHVSLDRDARRGADFLLRVKGDSMTGAGILEGDLVQVRRQDDARDGEIVVALVGEEGVVKRLRRRGAPPALESENPAYAPIPGPFQVVGKVVGLLRRY